MTNNKHKIILALCAFTLLTTTIFGQNTPLWEKQLSPFKQIHVSGKAVVELIKSNNEKIEVKSTEGISPKDITAEVKDGLLRVKSVIDLKGKIKATIYIYYKDINNILATNGADIRSLDTLFVENLKLQAVNSSFLEFKIESFDVNSVVSTNSTIVLAGTTHSQTIKATTLGTLSAFDLASRVVNATATTKGLVKITVKDSLKGSVTTKGAINVSGNPTRKEFKTKSGGEITEVQ